MEITDLGNSKKYNGMTLFALYRVKKIENILLQYFLYERLKKVNKAKQLPIIRSTIQALNSNFEVIKTHFSNFGTISDVFYVLL